MIRTNYNQGMSFRFENGYELSVQIGAANYCSRRDLEVRKFGSLDQEFVESNNAEIAVFRAGTSQAIPLPELARDLDNTWVHNNSAGRLANGWVGPNELVDWMIAVSRLGAIS